MKYMYGNSTYSDFENFNGRKAKMCKNDYGFSDKLIEVVGEIYINDGTVFLLNNYFDGKTPRTNDWKNRGFKYSWALCDKYTNLSDIAHCISLTILGLKQE